MTIPSPPILDARYSDVAERTEKLAEAFTRTEDAQGNAVPGWKRPPDGAMDMGRALTRVFEKMARHAIDRVNRVPDRSFLAFLDRTGVSPAEARAARVPLTFSLVARGSTEPTVPARTRVGAAALPGDTREVVFETERDLRTTRAKLAAVIVRQPDGDRLADRTAAATGQGAAFYDAFDQGDAAPHALHLAADSVLGLPAGTAVTVAFSVDSAAKWQALHAATLPALTADPYYQIHVPLAPLARWTYWNGAGWAPLGAALSGTNLTFNIPPNMAPVAVDGRTARWIRGELLAWPLAGIPKVNTIQASGALTTTGLAPDAALASGRPVDLTLDFHPFGEAPRLNDHLLIACDAALSRPGASVTVDFTLNTGTMSLKTADAPVLTWEISTGSGYKKLFDVTPTAATTNDVLRKMTFTVPAEAAPATNGNLKKVWLRVRLSGGSFGKGVTINYNTSPPTTTDDGYRPPIVKSITLSSTVTITTTTPLCTTCDDFAFADRAAPTPAAPLVPFSRAADGTPALYLGFDSAFTPVDTYLYFQVAPLDPVSAAKEASAAASGNIAWEYWSSAGNGMWAPLVCEDETRAFASSGIVRFVGPADLGRKSQFGRELFWIRARYSLSAALAADPPASPRLGRVLTNTVWARDAIARTNEILGSADGSGGQSFELAARPVLAGQRVEVREQDAPEAWVCWDEVSDFLASGPRDRHYTLDRAAGVVRFGDGRRGMAPPRGTRNVRAAEYSTGGGADGNRPAHTVEQLKTTVPYVDGVTNHEGATGGADADTPDDVKEWGPSVLRHGDRAVTAQDFEDLALEASPAVARARVITPSFDPILGADNPAAGADGPLAPGGVVLLIAATGADLPPAASTGLLRDVDAFLRARSGPAVALRIAGPSWIEVRVAKLTVTAASASGLEALRDRIERALHAFFHPITGNVDGSGWDFGQLPHESDVYRLVTSIPGVDRVGALEWTMSSPDGKPAPKLDDPALARVLVYPGRQRVEIFSPGGT
jgi:hypothetical protein